MKLHSPQVFVGFDSEVYCRSCYPKLWHTPLPPAPAAALARIPGRGVHDGCPRCGGKVFEAEKVAFADRLFHHRCFACRVCDRRVDALTAVSHQVGGTG
jgi:hypothetical protein